MLHSDYILSLINNTVIKLFKIYQLKDYQREITFIKNTIVMTYVNALLNFQNRIEQDQNS